MNKKPISLTPLRLRKIKNIITVHAKKILKNKFKKCLACFADKKEQKGRGKYHQQQIHELMKDLNVFQILFIEHSLNFVKIYNQRNFGS